MEIKQYFEPLLKWWWLILTACLLAGISSFLLVRQQPPVYQARTTLVIGSAVYEPNPSGGEFTVASQLAAYYANIGQREVVREATMEALELRWLPDYLVQVVPNSQLLEILVMDADPRRAQVVANELAAQLIKQTPSNPELDEAKHQEFINGQLALLESQITSTLAEIAQKEEELGDLNSAREIADTQQEISALQQKLLTLQTNYAAMIGSSSGQALNSLTVVEPAALPGRPVGPNKMMTILMSIAIAFAISAAAAYLIEYIDDTFKSSEEITKVLGLPVIGHIAFQEKNSDTGILVKKDPNSIIAEAFRSVSLNVDFMGVDKDQKMILITSVGPKEGKTFLATNLAWSLANNGKKVILLDTDLRRPRVHKILELSNKRGLSDVLRGEMTLREAIRRVGNEPLGVITSGEFIPNITGVLGSKRMDMLLDELRKQAEITILDGTPIPVTDSKVMATKADFVLLVIRYGQTRKGVAREVMKQLQQVHANVVGVIFNSIPPSRSSYKAYHYYYKAEDNGDEKPISVRRFPKLNLPITNPFKLKRS